MLGVILSQLLGLSRTTLAMARRGDLPRFLDAIHPRFNVPSRAVLFVGAAAVVVAALGTLKSIAAAASFAILVYYGVANLAALRMPPQAKRYRDAIPIVGLVGCVVLAASLSFEAMGIGAAVLVSGLMLHLLHHRS
jgi:APA family basic amino acid/polyamine antiporter